MTDETEHKRPLRRPLWTLSGDARLAFIREAAFDDYIEKSGAQFEELESDGGTPWFSSDDERRELWFRRYAPKSTTTMPLLTAAEIRGDHKRWEPAIPTTTKTKEKEVAA